MRNQSKIRTPDILTPEIIIETLEQSQKSYIKRSQMKKWKRQFETRMRSKKRGKEDKKDLIIRKLTRIQIKNENTISLYQK